MAARGSVSKELISQILFKTFPSAFVSGKEIRIPVMEDGAEVQIKVTLTAAKDNVARDNTLSPVTSANLNITDEDKAEVEALLKELGIVIES